MQDFEEISIATRDGLSLYYRRDSGAAWHEHHGARAEGFAPSDWTHVAKACFRKDADGRIVADHDPGTARPFREIPRLSDWWDGFRALENIPVLALGGANSDIVDAATFDEMTRVKPDLMRAIVPGRANGPFLYEPKSLAALDPFLILF
jgi:hypothetical protein